MRHNRLILITLALLLAGSYTATAQNTADKKNFTQEQLIYGIPKDVIKPMPIVIRWEDRDNYIVMLPDRKSFEKVDVKTGKRVAVSADEAMPQKFENETNPLMENSELVNVTLSPDGTKAAYTKADNNLYSYDFATSKETKLTTDGTNVLMNGYASWVYFEEILGRPSKYKAFWWSPDSKLIAYYKFDDSKVPMFPIYNSKGKHGTLTETHYPKAGDPNPEVKIGFVNANGGETVWADFNEKDDQYFGIPFWNADGNRFIVPWMPRDQNNLKLYAVNPLDGSKSFIYNEEQKTWIDWPEDMQFTADGFYMIRDFDLWEQIYFQSFDGKRLEKITDGNNWGINFIKVDQKEGAIYFTARREASDRVDFYRVNLKTKQIRRLTTGEYNYQAVNLSPDNKHFTAVRSNSHTPNQLVLFTVGKKNSTEKIIFDSKGEQFDNYKVAIPQMKYIMVDGYRLPAQIVYPVDMDSTKRYPVIISMYGGPNHGTVMDTWVSLARNQWWANEGVIQINIDHRASGHAGKKGLNEIHRNLLRTELHDYIEWVKWLRSKPYVNPDKVAITGFSYGGSMTMIAVTEGSEYFKYGIAGGGVYDYGLYDTHYTERYMDTPQQNPDGYAYTNTASKIAGYKGDRSNYVLITHGTSDDNVHMQNTMQLIDALQNAGKQFDLMLYPGEYHGYRGPKSRFSTVSDYNFWYRHLLERETPEILIKAYGAR